MKNLKTSDKPLRFDRKQQNSLKQLSFNKNKQINKNRTNKKREK